VTRQEKQAAGVVIRWAFNQRPLVEPAQLLQAFLVLAVGAEGVTPQDVSRWARDHA
jgi:hypothetical protein